MSIIIRKGDKVRLVKQGPSHSIESSKVVLVGALGEVITTCVKEGKGCYLVKFKGVSVPRHCEVENIELALH